MNECAGPRRGPVGYAAAEAHVCMGPYTGEKLWRRMSFCGLRSIISMSS